MTSSKRVVSGGARLEIQNSCLSIVVGCVFIANSLSQRNLFNRPFDDNWMELVPAWIWGSILIVSGVIHLLTMYRKLNWLRKQIILFKACLWLFLGVSVVQSEPLAPSAWMYIILAFSAVLAFWRIKIGKEGLPTNDTTLLERT